MNPKYVVIPADAAEDAPPTGSSSTGCWARRDSGLVAHEGYVSILEVDAP